MEKSSWTVEAHTFVSSTSLWWHWYTDLSEFGDSLLYRGSSRKTRNTQRKLVLKNQREREREGVVGERERDRQTEQRQRQRDRER